MLCCMNLHRLLEGQGRADRVRAGGELGPTHTAHEANISRRLQRRGIAFCLENHTRWIGQDHDGPRLGQGFADLLHDRRALINHITELVEESAEGLVWGWQWPAGPRGVNASGKAARPGV